MNLTNEECLQIAKENGADVKTIGIFGNQECVQIKFDSYQFLSTCAAIEQEVAKRVREDVYSMIESLGGDFTLQRLKDIMLSEEV